VQQGWKGIGSYSTIGMELAGSILLGLLAGRWLDKRFDTGSTLTLVGLALGLAAGGRTLWKALQRANREAEQMEQEERRARKAFHQSQQDDDDHPHDRHP
jgi:F0F1-type ATP synthase assembly protein I